MTIGDRTGIPPREIGAPRRRVEDRRLLTGGGRFTDDAAPAGAARAFVVRSPHAHARIRAIDTSRAAALPGVLAVLTGADAARDGMRPIPHDPDWTSPPDARLRLPEGFEVAVTPHQPLPADTVRYCGEAVALVVAETAAVAADAGEQVEVDYEPRPAVTDARAAMAGGAPRLWPGRPDNLALTCEVGDRAAADAAFAEAACVVSLRSWIHRVTGAPLEPRAVIGEYDPAAGRYTLRTGSGRGAVQTRARLAATLGVPVERCRAVFGDMGGNFGTRNAFSPEFALIPWAARRTGRPVKWTADRRECFLSDCHARDLVSEAALALDADGNILALRGANTLNLGAYAVYYWPLRKGLSMAQGVYRIPAVHFRGHAVLTNTAPTAVYRSAGRPEVIYMIERLIDLAAEEHGFDRVALRRRNLIAPGAMPYANAVGVTYDSGDYPAAMDAALDAADWPGFEARRAESDRGGLCRGIAVANYIEVTSGIPRERAELRAREDGAVELVVGTMSSGQGHETSFPQLVADWLGIPFERVRYVANDTDRVSVGGGSHSGRSMRLASIAIGEAVTALIERGRAVAAFALQAAPRDVAWREGAFHAESGDEDGGGGGGEDGAVGRGDAADGSGADGDGGEDGDGAVGRGDAADGGGDGTGGRGKDGGGAAGCGDAANGGDGGGDGGGGGGGIRGGTRDGSGASISLAEAAALAASDESLPAHLRGPLEGIGDITDEAGGFPYGSHVCEVEVDPETGEVRIAAWTGLDDVGLAINPPILHGQSHGAIVQGVGQALLEAIHYSPEDGQLLTGSFLDYAMPRADTMPPIRTRLGEVPASSHPFGIRPGGEGGATPALGLVVNAVCHALKDLGVRHVEMPLTPERVWRAIEAARENG